MAKTKSTTLAFNFILHRQYTHLEGPPCARCCAQCQGQRDKWTCFFLCEFTVKAREGMEAGKCGKSVLMARQGTHQTARKSHPTAVATHWHATDIFLIISFYSVLAWQDETKLFLFPSFSLPPFLLFSFLPSFLSFFYPYALTLSL